MKEPLQNGLEDALRRLREDSASKEAPKALEDTMLLAFRAHRAAVGRQRWRTRVPLAIAASLALAVVSRFSEPVKIEAPAIPVASAPASLASPDPAPAGPVATEKRKSPAKRRVRPTPRPTAQPLSLASSRPPREQQEFVEIPYAPPFTPYDEGHVVRVNMPGSSARRMGIPVLMDRVQADLVVGNDGLPRAIRVVSNSGAQFR